MSKMINPHPPSFVYELLTLKNISGKDRLTLCRKLMQYSMANHVAVDLCSNYCKLVKCWVHSEKASNAKRITLYQLVCVCVHIINF